MRPLITPLQPKSRIPSNLPLPKHNPIIASNSKLAPLGLNNQIPHFAHHFLMSIPSVPRSSEDVISLDLLLDSGSRVGRDEAEVDAAARTLLSAFDNTVVHDIAAPGGGVGVLDALHVELVVEVLEEVETDDPVVGSFVEGEGGGAGDGVLGVDSLDAVWVEDLVDAIFLLIFHSRDWGEGTYKGLSSLGLKLEHLITSFTSLSGNLSLKSL